MNSKLIKTLQSGGACIMRTDTLYGIVARADNEAAVLRVRRLKQRSAEMPLIVLIASADQAFDGTASIAQHSDSGRPTSVIVPSPRAPAWLRHPVNGTVAYRVPNSRSLRAILAKTGPLVAPSANPHGLEPAHDIETARQYFGDTIDYYHDGGRVPGDIQPSRIVAIETDGSETVVR